LPPLRRGDKIAAGEGIGLSVFTNAFGAAPIALAAGLFVVVATTGSGAQSAAPVSNPIPYAKASIDRGRTSFLQNCPLCHGEDGRAQGSAIAVAADLTRPDSWKNGSGDAALFSSIRNGAGDSMPPFGPLGQRLKDEEIWDLVNFIRSIGPEALQK